MTKTDNKLKQDIEDELRWDPRINASKIGVTVDRGAVSLLGTVDTYAEKWAAEDAMRRVAGVRTVAQDLVVNLLDDHKTGDSEIAVAIQNALSWNVFVPKSVRAQVERGSVTLEGQVTWKYQRDAAEHAVRHLKGILKIDNFITLPSRSTSHASATEVKQKVEAALQRQATSDASSIQVAASDGKVTLTGYASTWQAREDASNAAWAAAGVTEVIDNVLIAQPS